MSMDTTSFYFGIEDLWRIKLSKSQKKEDNKELSSFEMFNPKLNNNGEKDK